MLGRKYCYFYRFPFLKKKNTPPMPVFRGAAPMKCRRKFFPTSVKLAGISPNLVSFPGKVEKGWPRKSASV